MKNVNGEEINEALFLKKANEKIAEINELQDEEYFVSDALNKLIFEYGMIMYHYGAFMQKSDSIRSALSEARLVISEISNIEEKPMSTRMGSGYYRQLAGRFLERLDELGV